MSRVTQAHVDARTDSIRDAAVKLFIERGVDRVTMQEVASEAGLSAGAIYRYFPNKQTLLRDVFTHCTEMGEKAYAAAEGASSPLEALQIIGRTIWDRMVTEDGRRETAVAFETALEDYRSSAELQAERREFLSHKFDNLELLVREGQKGGQIDPTLDPTAVAMMLPAVAVGMQFFTMTDSHEVEPDAVLNLLLHLLARGAAAP